MNCRVVVSLMDLRVVNIRLTSMNRLFRALESFATLFTLLRRIRRSLANCVGSNGRIFIEKRKLSIEPRMFFWSNADKTRFETLIDLGQQDE